MLNIADSRFQAELLEHARAAGKIERDYAIPPPFCENTPERLEHALAPARAAGLFPDFPFGSEFTEVEAVLAKVLERLAQETATGAARARSLVTALRAASPARSELPYLERLGLDRPRGIKERLLQKRVLGAPRSCQES